jgi:TPR repeat protein
MTFAKFTKMAEAQRRFVLRRAAARGGTTAMLEVGMQYLEWDRHEEAEQWYRRAVDGGNSHAIAPLGALLSRLGRKEEAEQWHRRAALNSAVE